LSQTAGSTSALIGWICVGGVVYKCVRCVFQNTSNTASVVRICASRHLGVVFALHVRSCCFHHLLYHLMLFCVGKT
jgi:uncharacterized membrane protein AbrB (regulator of aidB expression)